MGVAGRGEGGGRGGLWEGGGSGTGRGTTGQGGGVGKTRRCGPCARLTPPCWSQHQQGGNDGREKRGERNKKRRKNPIHCCASRSRRAGRPIFQ